MSIPKYMLAILVLFNFILTDDIPLCFHTHKQIISLFRQEHNNIILLLLLLLLLTAIELSLGGSSPYSSTDETNENKYTETKQYQKKDTVQNKKKHILVYY